MNDKPNHCVERTRKGAPLTQIVSRLVYPKEMGNILKIKDSHKCYKKTKK
jgi:hypothetical protein